MLHRALFSRVVPSWNSLQVARLSCRRHLSSSSTNRKVENGTRTRNSELEIFYLEGKIPKQIPRHLHDDFIQLSKYEQERIYEKYSKLSEPEQSRHAQNISADFFTLNQRRQILKIRQGGLSPDLIALQFRVPVEGINDVLDQSEELKRKKPSIEEEIWINQRANSLMKESPYGFKAPDAYKRVRSSGKRVIRDYKQRKEAYPTPVLLENPDPKVETFQVDILDNNNSPV